MYKLSRCSDFVVGGARSLPIINFAIRAKRVIVSATDGNDRALSLLLNMPTCTVQNCARSVVARNICLLHYKRWWRHGDTNRAVKHGHAAKGRRTSEYTAWQSMIRRCSDSAYVGWADYGGRGITVTPLWLGFQGFGSFLAHVGPKPSPAHSLERIRVNDNYEEGNVRWATRAEQEHNKRSNVNITVNGITRCLTDWSNLTGIHYETIRGRLRRGWDPIRAVSFPSHTLRHGSVYLVTNGCGEYKIGRTTNLKNRIYALHSLFGPNLEIIRELLVLDTWDAEAFLHQKFQSQRLNGEWFALSQQDVEWFKTVDVHEINRKGFGSYKSSRPIITRKVSPVGLNQNDSVN